MPIEIRELIIRVNVPEERNTISEGNNELSRQNIEQMKKEIMEMCLDKVHDLLDRKLRR
jgi:hypothetical protein